MGTRMVTQRRAMRASQFPAQRRRARLRLRKEVVAVLHPVAQSLAVAAEAYGCRIRSRFCWGRLLVWLAALPGLQATRQAWLAGLPTG